MMDERNFIFYADVLATLIESNLSNPKFMQHFEEMGYKRANFENLKTELSRVTRCVHESQEADQVGVASGAV